MGDAREFRQKAALALFRVHVAHRFASVCFFRGRERLWVQQEKKYDVAA
jgi:hypothetical protein|tara:strand:- start:1571 stop:1717 length:147 start_codon:yes stop_codon:yes gene_type:complete